MLYVNRRTDGGRQLRPTKEGTVLIPVTGTGQQLKPWWWSYFRYCRSQL